ncbi:MAG: hypothetical protein ACLP1D_11575 [Xanthobacteraceae bacterium]|jgi:hypothetical protein
MSNWYESYASTEIGRKLSRIVNRPDRMFEFRFLSVWGKPAVQAVASAVGPIINTLPDKRARDEASQFCGWAVGQRMRRAGFEIAQHRGRVSDAPFKTGAVWRRAKPLQFTNNPGPVGEGGCVELGVERDTEGTIIGRWRLITTVTPGAFILHEMEGFREPIETAFRDAVEYAERYGFTTLRITDRDGLFPQEDRDKILLTLSQPSAEKSA